MDQGRASRVAWQAILNAAKNAQSEGAFENLGEAWSDVYQNCSAEDDRKIAEAAQKHVDWIAANRTPFRSDYLR